MNVTSYRDMLAILETLKAHPDDDIPRFELADWLEKHGRLEAERDFGTFIRLQCQLDRRVVDSRRKLELGIPRPEQEQELKEFDKLLNQAKRLLSMHQVSWLGAWLPWIREETLRGRSFWR